jgi:hypothetical protein
MALPHHPAATARLAKPWQPVRHAEVSLAEKHVLLRDELIDVLGDDCRLRRTANGDSAMHRVAVEPPEPMPYANEASPRAGRPDEFLARDAEGGWAAREGKPYEKAARLAAEEATLPDDVRRALQLVRSPQFRRRAVDDAESIVHPPRAAQQPFGGEVHPSLAAHENHVSPRVHQLSAAAAVAPLAHLLDRQVASRFAEVPPEAPPVAPTRVNDGRVIVSRNVREAVRRAEQLAEETVARYARERSRCTREQFEREAQERCSTAVIDAIGGVLGDEDDAVGLIDKPGTSNRMAASMNPNASPIDRRFTSNLQEINDLRERVRQAVHDAPGLNRKPRRDSVGDSDDEAIDFDSEDTMRRSSTNSDRRNSAAATAVTAKKAWRVLQGLVGGRAAGSIAQRAMQRMQKKVGRHNAEKQAEEQSERDRLKRHREDDLVKLKTAITKGTGNSTLLAHLRKAAAVEVMEKKEQAQTPPTQALEDLFMDVYRNQANRNAALLNVNTWVVFSPTSSLAQTAEPGSAMSQPRTPTTGGNLDYRPIDLQESAAGKPPTPTHTISPTVPTKGRPLWLREHERQHAEARCAGPQRDPQVRRHLHHPGTA